MKRTTKIILFHILFWILNIVRNIIFFSNGGLLFLFFDQLLIASMCYLNYFFLFPYILKKNKAGYYILWAVIFWSCFTLVYACWLYSLPYLFLEEKISDFWIWVTSFNIAFLYAALSSGSRLLIDWDNNIHKNEKLLLQKTNTQIQWMKSNVNIPFMLDALNYAEQAALKSPKYAEQPIVLLSDVLRYGLYEAESPTTSLLYEIEVIQQYISLQNLIHPETQLQLQASGVDTTIQVPPNALLRFISVWKSQIHSFQATSYILQIQTINYTVCLNLPLSDNSFIDASVIEKNFVAFANEYFEVSYQQEKENLRLTIRSTRS